MTTSITSVSETESKIQVNGLDALTFNSAGEIGGIRGINGGQLAGMRNRIINGGMQVAQRGNVVFTSTAALYGGCDRYLSYISATTVTAIALRAAVGVSATSTGYAHQLGNVTTTGSTLVQLQQRVESLNSESLVGKTVTFSGKVLQITGASQTLHFGFVRANAVDNFSAQTSLQNTTISIPNNVWTAFSFTTTLSDSLVSNGLMTFCSYSLGAQANTQFYFGDWQLEIGPVATPFEHRPYGMELALCQRYYYRNFPGAVNTPFGSGYASSANVAYGCITFPVSMRVAPTSLEQNGLASSYLIAFAATSVVCNTVPILINATKETANLAFTVAGALTTGHGVQFRADVPAFLGFPAEL